MKNYFLNLAIFGLICEFLFSWSLGFSPISFLTVDPESTLAFGTIFLIGIVATVATGKYLDRKWPQHTPQKIFAGPLIFFVGTIIFGVTNNFLIMGVILDNSASFSANFQSYFVTPALVMCMYGLPAAFIVSILFFGISKIKFSLSASR